MSVFFASYVFHVQINTKIVQITFEYRNYCLNLHLNVDEASLMQEYTLTIKRIIKWLTELQRTAQHAVHAWQSALQAQFQKVISTRSTLTYALTAVHALTLAQWEQSFQSNYDLQQKKVRRLSRTFGLF